LRWNLIIHQLQCGFVFAVEAYKADLNPGVSCLADDAGPGTIAGDSEYPKATKRGGRVKGVPNKITRDVRETIAIRGRPIEFLCDMAAGRRIRVSPAGPGPTEWYIPSVEDRKWAVAQLLPCYVPKMQAMQLSGPDGGPIKSEATRMVEPNTRQIARAILGILSEANIKDEVGHGPALDPMKRLSAVDLVGEQPARPASPLDNYAPAPTVAEATAVASPSNESVAAAQGAGHAASAVAGPLETGQLQPGGGMIFDNGAEVRHVGEFNTFAIYDFAGRLHGYRRLLSDATAFATSLKPSPDEAKVDV
jgi:hypothetical protein